MWIWLGTPELNPQAQSQLDVLKWFQGISEAASDSNRNPSRVHYSKRMKELVDKAIVPDKSKFILVNLVSISLRVSVLSVIF